MKKEGLNIEGIEPGPYNKKESLKYNLNISNKNLSDLNKERKKYDLITLNHVLEHIDNPRDTLQGIKKIMNKESILIIGVPNNNSLAKIIFQKNWYQWDIPRHIVNYSTKSLRELLKEERFEIIKTRYNSRPSQFVVSLYYLLNIKRPCKAITGALNLLFLPLTWAINILKIGDQIEIWCKKN
jgi:2-polyprenyl-3-methyl-5-hydroxy-6-metoxy-1,4-benzoquinol methylase